MGMKIFIVPWNAFHLIIYHIFSSLIQKLLIQFSNWLVAAANAHQKIVLSVCIKVVLLIYLFGQFLPFQ